MAATALRDGRAPGNEWSESRRAELSNQIASAQLTVDEACARHGLPAELVQDWLRSFRRSVVSAFDEKLKRTLLEQGAEVASGAAEFAGTLEEISVIDWIQSVEVTRKSALISVAHDGCESRVWCANGALVDAESGRLRGEPALYRIVSFEQGRVWVEFGAVRRARTIYTSTPSLLLEAAHRKDEAARLWRKLGDGRRAFRATEQAARKTAYSSQVERRLLESFQQPSSLRDVVERSELGDVETLTLLTQLSESQFIAAAPASPPAAAGEGEPGDWAGSSRTLTTLSRVSGQRAFPRWILPSWAWSGLAAITLVTLVALSRFEGASRSEATSRPEKTSILAATPADAARAAPEPPRAETPSYRVATSFEPAAASIWLDGQLMSGGALNTTLPKDGQAHELRAVAPGYASAFVVFVDAPPPRLIHLETLPAIPAVASGEGPAATESREPVHHPEPVQADLVVLTAKLPRAAARRPQRTRPPERAPAIQTIDATTPTIRVIP